MHLPSPRRPLQASRAWWAQSLYGNGFRRIRELDLDTHALALCAQQVLCTAPLLVAMSAVLQRTTGYGISTYMSRFFGLHDRSADAVEQLFVRSSPSISTVALVIALMTAVVFSTSVGAVQQRAFELIWTLPRVIGVRSYARQLIWAVGLTAFSIGILLAGRAGRWINNEIVATGVWAPVVLQGTLTFLFYWWSQRWLLGGRLAWRALLPGAIAVGVGTTILVRLTRVILPPQISWQVRAYGQIGTIFLLSAWLMILSAVVFGGVLFGALFVQRRMAKGDDPGVESGSPLTFVGLASAAAADETVDTTEPRPDDQELSSMYSSTSRSESSMPRPSG